MTNSRRSLAGPLWNDLSTAARLYVAAVTLAGVCGLVLFFPRTLSSPGLFAVLVVFGCLTSSWKVNLPIPVVNGSTLSVSYAANVTALLLLGPSPAIIVALAGVMTQCLYRPRERYPLYRTLFSGAAVALTMIATGQVYVALGGPVAPFDSRGLAKPLVGAIATYFLVNTTLVAVAIAVSTGRRLFETWRNDFLWLGASFMAAGTAGALAAIVVERGEHWKAVLLIAPIFLTYRTYGLFVGRLEDHRRHMAELSELHEQTVSALNQARTAELALASEKERLTAALEERTRLEIAQEELLEREHAARAGAEEANRLKDEFLATVSHELRTPLSAILVWSDMLRRGTIQEPLRERALTAIYNGGKRQAQLIDDLLDVSRIISGKLRVERTVVALRTVVSDAVQVIQPAADANDVRIHVDVDPSIGPVYGDAGRLQQIVWNLLSNAVKFTPAGGAVNVQVRHAARDTAELIVSDTGHGIAPDFLRVVFDPFRQADGTSTRAYRGLGIGLSIVKALVEAHRGTVSAYSAGPGKGATFVVRLPLANTVPAVAPGHALPLGSELGTSLGGVSVLVVDDDLESREIVAAYLRTSGAQVTTSDSAAVALDTLTRQAVDVLIADIGMPEEDGYSLVRRVRALNGRAALVPAAALTAFVREEDRQRSFQAGFQMHLAKPVDPAALLAAVAALAGSAGCRSGPSTSAV
jgi:signal transduction histidine kinase/ActR/RegA family two-component response regulator